MSKSNIKKQGATRLPVLQSVKKLPISPRFWYNKGNGGCFYGTMEKGRKK